MPIQKITIEQVVAAATTEFSTSPLENVDETFDDLLHAVVNSTRRATSDDDAHKLCNLLHKLFFLCDNNDDDDDNTNRWKMLLLSFIYKRYHSKAPEAKETRDDDEYVAGQGERLIFYTAVGCLHRYEIQNGSEKSHDRSRSALNCLARIAPLSGGSRDVCTIIEIGVYSILSQFIAERNGKSLPPSALVAEAIKIAVSDLERASFLSGMLEVAANALDNDLEIIKKDKTGVAEENPKVKKELPSTFNVYVPHHGRGKVSKKRSRNSQQKMSNRNLVQSVAEILIWSKTTVAMSNCAFSSAYEEILRSASSDKPWYRLQTVVRNIRKDLNKYSRGEGFMLGNQFALDATCITPAMIGKAKAGDLSELTRLAKKKEASRVLKLINMRYALDPSRVSPFESVGELIRSWVSLNDNEIGGDEIVEDDSTKHLELDIQRSKINATVEKLRSKRKKNSQDNETSAVVAALDNSIPNMVSAVLITASMNDWPEDKDAEPENTEINITAAQEEGSADESKHVLYLGETLTKLSSFETTIDLLNSIIAGKYSASCEAPSFSNNGVATTKAVINLIDRHMEDGNILMLFSSANLQLPNERMEALTERKCAVHCHDADVFGARLQRERAKSGDITISLAWDTIDDLDLHVVIPSGEELYYGCSRSTCGLGMLDVDMNASYPKSKEPVENVFIGKPDDLIQAPKGKYKVIVQNYSYHSTQSRDKSIPWRVLVDKNGEKTPYTGECKGSGSSSNVVACEFDYDGRTVPFPKELDSLSAFGASNLVNITASTGETFESLIQLMDTRKDIDELNRVRELAVQVDEGINNNRPLVAATDQLEVTSRDRLYMQLCKLPSRFHHMVEEALGGGITLAEKCARDVARLMLKDNLHISKLEQSGYPEDIIVHIKSIMKKGSVPAT
mmetsp:Transcript_13067/g.19223  ORF Transcript_13067/g.19223 Transcript_13067/m.19223 type:complete len:906 (+) Transcript_13067:72-2789(+)|eukprot:CAMPEP_0194200626 /NCGR_PEP_ID=MMETSP0156-20130528/1141_1 /TAXON_ID=33649 /ORGANISM="Thalassionema nitzschioides, Strain L26-B" /LENGTH=905 /DNA_ID=CAMNT_0038925641 /DNA_START=63 /DNA_END=2780 /DNA_ORIENTATION=+